MLGSYRSRFSLAGLLVIFTLGLIAAPPVAAAQRAGGTPRIGVLDYGSASAGQHLWRAFGQRLREFGYVEGENITFEYRWADGKVERLPDLAAELVRLKVNVIVAATVPGALAAKGATKTIPIVFWAVSDPVRLGLVASLARPDGNITGVSGLSLSLAGKRLELLREIVPGASRFVVLWDQPNPNSRLYASETEIAARALAVPLQAVSVRDANEFSRAFLAMRREGAGALIVAPSSMFFGQRRQLADLAMTNRLPTVFPQREYVREGGLMAYGANLLDESRRAAVYVAKILKGTRPADLPVDQARKFELVINLKTAKALGLTIPQSILLRADEVIE